MFQFAWPYVFLLIPMAFIVRRFLPAYEQQSISLEVPFYQLLTGGIQQDKKTQSKLWRVLAYAIWIMLLIAAARPQWVGEPIPLPLEGRDLMLAVDISGSMETRDMKLNGRQVTRLVAVKKILSDFIERRQGDRLGLILFGRNAYLQTPLSFDLETVNTLLNEAVIGLAGKETAIGDAIGLGIKRLKKQKENERVLILLTDGANTAGEIQPLKAAQLAAQAGLRIHTIGIGADSMAVSSIFGQRMVNPSADLDENALKQIANQTGGKYFRARNTKDLGKIYALIDEIEPIASEQRSYRPVEEYYRWPLMLILLLLIPVWVRQLKGVLR
ncbi:MAG: vWA domain-containing protein [bacterium]